MEFLGRGTRRGCDISTFTKFKYEQRGTQMGSSVRYNRTLEPYLRSRGRENEVINDFCHAPSFPNITQ